MTETDIMLHVSHGDDVPNVVRLNLPSDHSQDGAAWVYVPSKDVIYIGPPGSYADGGTVDLASTVRNLVDTKKDEKLVSGILFDDGFVDYFTAADEDEFDRIVDALDEYHGLYYTSNGAFKGSEKSQERSQFDNYPTEDDTGFDPEDEHDNEDDDPIYDPDSGALIGYLPKENRPTLNVDDIPDDDNWSWLKGRDWTGGGDYSQMKSTPGTSKPISEWSKEDHLDWRDQADRKRSELGYGWAAREDLNHFRWSFGDENLVTGAPHQGLWLWPTQSGYPDHFSQTGHDGLGRCAQGRVYPHFNNKWEILTWPDRPREVKDKLVRDAIQAEAQQAVKQYLIDRIGIKESDIFFTKMHYGDAVSNYDSPAYPGRGYSKSKGTPGLDAGSGENYDWDTEKGNYDWYGRDEGTGNWNVSQEWDPNQKKWITHGPHDTNQLSFDDDGNASLVQKKSPYYEDRDKSGDATKLLDKVLEKMKQKQEDIRTKRQFTDSAGNLWVYDPTKSRYRPANEEELQVANSLTPEEKWEQAVQEHERTQTTTPAEGTFNGMQLWADSNGTDWVKAPEGWVRKTDYLKNHRVPDVTGQQTVPEGESTFNTGDAKYHVHKSNGQITTITEQDYEDAVREFGEDNWWHKFMGQGDKMSNIHDYDPDTEMSQGFIDSLRSQGQPTGQSSFKTNNGPVKQEAFCWLGVGYGDDAGDGDTKDAELITGLAHWNIVNRLLGKKIQTIHEFMSDVENGQIPIPMVWGWVSRHPMLKGVYVQFLSHLMGNSPENLQYIPQALAAISSHYKQPIESYDIDESTAPILERMPVSGKPEGGGTPSPTTPKEPVALDIQKSTPVVAPPGAQLIEQDHIGEVTVSTYQIKQLLFETEIAGGELDGSVYPSYSLSEATRMHDTIVRDEESYQRTAASKLVKSEG